MKSATAQATRKDQEATRMPSRGEYDPELQIRERAYELYQERGMAPGRELDDWLQAEGEVLSGTAPLAHKTAA